MTAHRPDHPLPADESVRGRTDEQTWSDDELDGLLAAGEDDLRASLAQILAPPADFETRVAPGAAAGLMNRSIVGTAGDLLLVGWQTLRFLVLDPPDEVNDDPEPDDGEEVRR